ERAVDEDAALAVRRDDPALELAVARRGEANAVAGVSSCRHVRERCTGCFRGETVPGVADDEARAHLGRRREVTEREAGAGVSDDHRSIDHGPTRRDGDAYVDVVP